MMKVHYPRIASITVTKKKYPLKKPYILSFATLKNFSSIRVCIKLENEKFRVAEVVPLYGYSKESEKAIVENIKKHSRKILRKTTNDARSIIEKYIPKTPFASSPLLTAIDLFEYEPVVPFKINFVIPASVEKRNELKKAILKNKYLLIKIKLCGVLKKDIEAVRFALKISNQKNQFALDANQAYHLKNAIKFYSELNDMPEKKYISYLEQPLGVNEWKGHAVLRKKFPGIDTMLDESIITYKDISKANKIGIRFIKLKLFKQGGIKETINLAEKAKKVFNMNIVIGNGVATHISNDIENWIYSNYNYLFWGASEANGYLKLKK